jgi:hypothetical protein
MKLRRHPDVTETDLLDEPPKLDLPPELLWLLDAPMFIDEKQVDAFYDAVVRPDYEGSSLTLSKSVSKSSTFGGNLTLGAALPWFGKAEGGISAERTGEHGQGLQRALTPVSNSYRHLLTLALHYATADNLSDRLLVFDGASSDVRTAKGSELPTSPWEESAPYLIETPRVLAFLDLPADTRFIPAALELTDGSTVMLFDAFGKMLCEADEHPPPYPGSRSDRNERDEYWRWFSDKFNDPKISADRKALQLVESSVNSQNRIEWNA